MHTSCSEAFPQPPPVTFLILVSCISLFRSYSICTTLAMPHKYAAVYLEIPTSHSHRKTAKSTPVLYEKGQNNWQRVSLEFCTQSFNRESSTAQWDWLSSTNPERGWLEAPSESGTGKHKEFPKPTDPSHWCLSQPALFKQHQNQWAEWCTAVPVAQALALVQTDLSRPNQSKDFFRH